jgi:acetyl esterase/lipase
LDIVGRRAVRPRQIARSCPPGGVPNHYDIPYASLPNVDQRLNSLDIYSPGSMDSHPMILYVHGGGWKEGDKSQVGGKPSFFVKRDIIFISINHRLSPSVWFPVHLKDVARAISWAIRKGGEYGGDPSNLFIMGSSSGAHLVSTIALDDSYLASEGLKTNVIRGVISIDTRAYDIPFLMSKLPRGGKRLYETTFGKNKTALAKASPITYVDNGNYLPSFLIAFSGNDPNFKTQAERFSRRLKEFGGDVVLVPSPNKTHAGITRDIGMSGDPISKKILDFIDGNGRA